MWHFYFNFLQCDLVLSRKFNQNQGSFSTVLDIYIHLRSFLPGETSKFLNFKILKWLAIYHSFLLCRTVSNFQYLLIVFLKNQLSNPTFQLVLYNPISYFFLNHKPTLLLQGIDTFKQSLCVIWNCGEGMRQANLWSTFQMSLLQYLLLFFTAPFLCGAINSGLSVNSPTRPHVFLTYNHSYLGLVDIRFYLDINLSMDCLFGHQSKRRKMNIRSEDVSGVIREVDPARVKTRLNR